MATNGELRRKRVALGLTGAEVAASLGKTPASLSRWESGTRRPSSEDAVAWMRLLMRLEHATVPAGGDAA